MERLLYQLLAVAGDGAAADNDAVAEGLVYLQKLTAYYRNGFALVGAVVCINYLAVGCDDHELCGGRAAVDTDVYVAAVIAGVGSLDAVLCMAADERPISVHVLKQRRQGGYRGLLLEAFFKPRAQHIVVQQIAVGCVQRRAYRYGEQRVLGKYRVIVRELQRLCKALSETLAVVQWTAQEHDLAVDPPALCQSADSLIDDSLVYRGRDIRLGRALIYQGLDVRFGENSAA